MYGKRFLGNMTENLQADCVQSRQAGFILRFLLYHDAGRSASYRLKCEIFCVMSKSLCSI